MEFGVETDTCLTQQTKMAPLNSLEWYICIVCQIFVTSKIHYLCTNNTNFTSLEFNYMSFHKFSMLSFVVDFSLRYMYLELGPMVHVFGTSKYMYTQYMRSKVVVSIPVDLHAFGIHKLSFKLGRMTYRQVVFCCREPSCSLFSNLACLSYLLCIYIQSISGNICDLKSTIKLIINRTTYISFKLQGELVKMIEIFI